MLNYDIWLSIALYHPAVWLALLQVIPDLAPTEIEHQMARKLFRRGIQEGFEHYYILPNGSRDGIYQRRYPSGILAEESYWENGRLHGRSRQWNEDGELIAECYYQDNKPSGIGRQWYDNGLLSSCFNYDNGEKISWSITGLRLSFTKVNGLQRIWYRNGQLAEAFYMTGNRRTGPYYSWYRNGQKRIECQYACKNEWVDDQLHGPYLEWFANGLLSRSCEYHWGRRHKQYREWNEDGYLMVDLSYYGTATTKYSINIHKIG